MTERILFGAGCFWGVEDAFRGLDGVVATRVGFAGGTVEAPTYRQVCDGDTGHAEVVEVEFDPERVALAALLDYFWSQHDASRAGGGQYRSIVVCATPEQEAVVAAVRARMGRTIRTEVRTGSPFYEAEAYHQQYFEKQRERASELVQRAADLAGGSDRSA
jgi:methionine-S-sulfoxide reductase